MTNWNFQFNQGPMNFKRNSNYSRAKQKSVSKFVIALIISTIILLVAWYFIHPVINWHSPVNFLNLIGLGIYFAIVISFAMYYHIITIKTYQKLFKYFGILVGLVVVFVIGLGVVTSPIFNAKEYASRVEVQQVDFDVINEVDFNKTPIIDRESTVALGDRVMGQMPELVSQFEVSDDYRRTVEVYEVSLFSSASSATIQHKDAKWFDLKENLGLDNDAVGSFNYDQRRFTADMSVASEGLQATHTYIDTIYVHKGSNVKLILPTSNKSDGTGTSSVWTYQRWYSYRTDKTFATNGSDGVYDLLTPNDNKQAYRFTNGYVGKPLSDDIVQSMTFHYPTEDEFDKWFPNSQVDNDWYVVACDVSGYTDFSKDFDSKGNGGNYGGNGSVSKETILANAKTQFTDEGYYEPTLALRVIYYIVGVDDRDMPEGSDKKANWDSWYGKLTTSDYQGGTIEEGKKYLEEYDITFPNKHLYNYT